MERSALIMKLTGEYNEAVVYADEIDSATTGQVKALLKQESVRYSKIRIMPDCHAGMGCVIGTTMTVVDKVIPNLVGVDIGCGVLVVKLKEKRIELPKLDSVIHKHIPSGFAVRETRHKNCREIPLDFLLCKAINSERAYLSIGTLGGGNHFIEIDKDDDDNHYLVIHSGSRNLGKQLAEYYQQKAFDNLNKGKRTAIIDARIKELSERGRQNEIQAELVKLKEQMPIVPKELSYLEGDDFDSYIHDMKLAQEFAVLNRRTIADVILKEMGWHEASSFETIHNYIDMRTEEYDGGYMLRKGAVSALEGERLIIPINMRDGCVIAVGKGNEEYNKSAPHGAGRLLSRTQAFNSLGMKEFRESMEGIYSSTVNQSTLDESPMAYKPLESILKHITDTVEVEAIVKPIYNFKASEAQKRRK